jgi:hypothetical protein
MFASFRNLDLRYVQCDGDAGPVAPREKPFAAKLATDANPGQCESRVSERHCMQLALDPALSPRFRLRRRVMQRAVEGGNACGRVSERIALREAGVQLEPIDLAGTRHVVVAEPIPPPAPSQPRARLPAYLRA